MLNKEKIEQKYAKKIARVNKKIDLCKGKEDLVVDISIDSEISDTNSKELKKLAALQKKYKDNPTEKNKHKFNALHDKYLYTNKAKAAKLRHKIKVYDDYKAFELLSKAEKRDRRTDLSFYRANVSGYYITLTMVLFEIIYMILTLSIMERNYWIGIMILVNIAFLLFLFSCAIKIKNYKKKFSLYLIAFSIYCVFRITLILVPLMHVNIAGAKLTKQIFIYGFNIYMIIFGILIGITSYRKVLNQEKYIAEGKISFKQMSK